MNKINKISENKNEKWKKKNKRIKNDEKMKIDEIIIRYDLFSKKNKNISKSFFIWNFILNNNYRF